MNHSLLFLSFLLAITCISSQAAVFPNPTFSENAPTQDPLPRMPPGLGTEPSRREIELAPKPKAKPEMLAQVEEKKVKSTEPMGNLLPSNSQAAVLLNEGKFYPSTIRAKRGEPLTLWFTSANRRPGAVVMDLASTEKWIGEKEAATSELSPALIREITFERITEIQLLPTANQYSFFDAISGARGVIEVE